jgi:hypothetical protein
LRKRHAQELIPATEPAKTMVTAIPLHAGIELMPRDEVHQLGKDQLAGSHAMLLFQENPEKGADSVEAFSNRARHKLDASRCWRATFGEKSPA